MPSDVSASRVDSSDRVAEVVRRVWGFDDLRPLQAEAIRAGLEHRDSLVVMPTGGGKSLCYQVPPLVAGRLDVVVSPLISLMKDQVDGLRANGYPAAAVHSHLSASEKRTIIDGLHAGEYRLLLTSPERLFNDRFLRLLDQLDIRAFAIDEAHCISHWGHDFRPEYRRLSFLKQRFPNASLHAFTATATPRVREDIVAQLGLVDPQVLVGRFDRPNLIYRFVPRVDQYRQTVEIIRRHPREAVIVYCITRSDTEALAGVLQANGINGAAYHAGLEGAERRRVQDAFAAEHLDVVVATVAFGMGIDRSNVRCVVHAAMPKSIEHYQQETGRAGRDGLEAECVLLYSAADAIKWERLLQKSAGESDDGEAALAAQLELLGHIQGMCGTLRCRHRALSRYFGQDYEHDDCGACDVCLDEVDGIEDSTVIAQKILSCVARLGQRYGVGYLVEILRGADTATVRSRRHTELSTYGILRERDEKSLTNLVYQLLDQELISRTEGDRPVLVLNDDSLAVLRGEREVKLVEPLTGPVRKAKIDADSWEGVDEDLFEHLRELRRTIAAERSVPAYVIFGDRSLRSMARIRPTSPDTMRLVHGVGEKKLADLGERFCDAIRTYCDSHQLTMDVLDAAEASEIVVPRQRKPSPQRERAMELFAKQRPIEEIAQATGRAVSTIGKYLEEYIIEHKPANIDAWIDSTTYDNVAAAIDEVGTRSFKPIYEKLERAVSYEVIRLVAAHRRARSEVRA